MNRNTAWIATICFVLSIFNITTPAMAQDAELAGLIKALQKQMTDLQSTVMAQKAEIQALKSQGANIQVVPGNVEATPPMSETEFKERLSAELKGSEKWLKNLKFSGDLRLRYEAFSGTSDETDARNRFRYRLRFGFEKKFSDELTAGFALASGEGPRTSALSSASAVNVDPTSTNTSFDDDFSFKPIYIEKAYASYTPNWAKIGPIEKFNVTAGKMNNPFEKGSSDIVWDRDVKPEGIAEKIDIKLMDTENFDMKGFFTAGQFVLDEDGNTSGGGDANLFAFQLGLNPVIYTGLMERPVDLLTAFSFYDWSNYGKGSNFIIGGTSLARGNPARPGYASELAAGNFHVWEIYNEVAFYPYGLPVRPYFDWLWNSDSAAGAYNVAGSNANAAYAFGVKLGGINKKGDWEGSYAYKWIGANATPGFNDSDFGNTGHSGKCGSVIKAGYALTDYLTLNGAMFFVDNLNAGTAGIRDEHQNRFQLDLSWKF